MSERPETKKRSSKLISELDRQIEETAHIRANEHVEISRIIIEVVDSKPGYPLGIIFSEVYEKFSVLLTNVPNITPIYIQERLDDLSIIGELTRLVISSSSPGFMETLYYPKDFRFVVTPRNMIISSENKSPLLSKILNENDARLITALHTIIDNTSNVHRINIIHRYCWWCGEVDEGHRCSVRK